MDLLSVIFAIIVSFGTFGASLYALDRFWLKVHHCVVPLDKQKTDRELHSKREGDEETRTVKTLHEMLETYLPLIIDLDSEYWIKQIGVDGYTYLYFQKQLIKILVIFGILSCLVLIPVTIWYGGIDILQHENDLTWQTHKAEIRYYQELRSIIDCLLVCFLTFYIIYTMFEIKKHIRKLISEQKKSRSAQSSIEKLKARSVHVRGVFPEDRRGEVLCNEVRDFLEVKAQGRPGKIVASIIVHDFVRIVELENDRKRVDNAHKLLTANEPAVRRIFFPKKYRQQDYYEKKLKAIDDKVIDRGTSKS